MPHHHRPAVALEDLGQGPELLLRQVPRAQGHQPRDPREQGHGLHRPVGLRQVDPAAHLQPHVRAVPGAARRRHDRARRREPADLQAGRGADPRQGRHGVPEADAVPDVDLRQHRLRREAVREPERFATWTTASNGRCKKAALWTEVRDKLQQSGSGLSGGQQQRLCIARGIAIKPEVLLLDEPCSALDPISTAKIEELIAELKKRVHRGHRDPQHAAGGALQRLHRLHVPGRPDRVRRDRSRSSSSRSARRPRTTSPAVSAEGDTQ